MVLQIGPAQPVQELPETRQMATAIILGKQKQGELASKALIKSHVLNWNPWSTLTNSRMTWCLRWTWTSCWIEAWPKVCHNACQKGKDCYVLCPDEGWALPPACTCMGRAWTQWTSTQSTGLSSMCWRTRHDGEAFSQCDTAPCTWTRDTGLSRKIRSTSVNGRRASMVLSFSIMWCMLCGKPFSCFRRHSNNVSLWESFSAFWMSAAIGELFHHALPTAIIALNRSVRDGNSYASGLIFIPEERLVEKDWYIAIHWEDQVCRGSYQEVCLFDETQHLCAAAMSHPGTTLSICPASSIFTWPLCPEVCS